MVRPFHILSLLVAFALAGCLSVINPQAADPHLVFHCTFDDVASVDHPAVGQPGEHTDLRFVDGVSGKALYVPAGQAPVHVDFTNGLPMDKGCISYWIKLLDQSTAFSGNTYFLSFNGWFMMHRISTNTGAGTSGWQASIGGFHLYGFSGCGSRPYASLFPAEVNPKDWHHYEFVWNTNGIHGA